MAWTPWGDDAVDDSAYNDPEPDDDDVDPTLCEQDGHDYDILDGRCRVCGEHKPAERADG